MDVSSNYRLHTVHRFLAAILVNHIKMAFLVSVTSSDILGDKHFVMACHRMKRSNSAGCRHVSDIMTSVLEKLKYFLIFCVLVLKKQI